MDLAWFCRLALALPALAVPLPASAAPSELVTFAYRTPAECATRDEFSTQVAARTTRWLEPSSPFKVMVSIERVAQGLRGSVTFERADQSTVRELHAVSCDELVPALAFIVAVLIDPQANAAPLPSPAPQPSPTGLVTTPPLMQPPPTALWFSAGTEVALGTLPTRGAAFGERVSLGMGGGDRSRWLSSVRLTLGRTFDHLDSPGSRARAEFLLAAARFEGCLLRVAMRGFAFEPCPFVELGRLSAVGIHPESRVTRHEIWGAFGLALRPTWTFSRRLVLGAGLGLDVPLGRYRFAFTREPELASTPELGLEASLSLSVRFP